MNPVSKSLPQIVQPLPQECPKELEAFVAAVKAGRAHIIAHGKGYRIHIGSLDTMQLNSCSMQMGNIGISGVTILNANDNWLDADNFKIPLKQDNVQLAIAFSQK